MSQFLETLKLRVDEAQKRFQEATAKFQTAQLEHQAAAQQFNSWNTAYQSELRKEQGDPAPTNQPTTVTTTITLNHHGVTTRSDDSVNKTEIVRSVLRQNPGGIAPNDLWKAVNAQITHRPYLYSILKRLNDKGDVFKKRGKYFPKLTTKAEEAKDEAMVQ